jgi:predicted oxidoreductase (fatty acid repression mutant protein)
VNSRIQNVTSRYTKFENVLPEELSHTQITEELEDAKNEINNIIEEDLRNVKSLSNSQNKAVLIIEKKRSVNTNRTRTQIIANC